MSIDLMAAVWKDGPDETVQRFVLLALANYADQDGYCWPSYNSIAERCAISRSTAIRAVKALEEGGWIRRQTRQTRTAQNSSNGYFVNLTRLGMVAERHQGSSTAPPPSSTVTPGIVAQRHQGSSTAPPGVVAERHPILHSESSLIHQSEAVSEVEDGDGNHDAAVAAGKRILTRWTQLTGRAAPRDDEEWWRDWLIPVNQLWVRVGRDEDAAFKALVSARQQMVNSGRTPFRPAALIPYMLAEMDRSEVAVDNGRPETVEQWTDYFAEA